MDSCSIEVGNSVNIKRSDGKSQSEVWKKVNQSFCQLEKEKNGFYDRNCKYLYNNFLLRTRSESSQ